MTSLISDIVWRREHNVGYNELFDQKFVISLSIAKVTREKKGKATNTLFKKMIILWRKFKFHKSQLISIQNTPSDSAWKQWPFEHKKNHLNFYSKFIQWIFLIFFRTNKNHKTNLHNFSFRNLNSISNYLMLTM